MKIIKNPLILVLLSGILCTLSMYPFSFSFLIRVALVPFLYVLLTSKFEKKKTLGMEYSSPAVRGLILGVVFYYTTLHWFYDVLGFSGLALLIILALYLYTFSLVLRLLLNKRSNLYIQMFLPAILWVAIEFFKSEGWRLKFTWMNLGYSQYNNPYLLQFASIAGQYGITFMIVLVNTIFALTIIHRKNRKFILASGVSILTIFAAMFGWGYLQNQKTFNTDISVGMVQYEPYPSDLNPIDIYDNLAQGLTGDYDFMIFPEYTSTEYLEETPYNRDVIVDIATRNDAYVVAGSNYREDVTKDDHYNTAYLFSPKGENIGKFYKMNPVQFFKDGMPGKEFKTFDTEFGKVGIMICYDMDYSYVSRKITANGAEVLFIPTFDARHWGKFQHLQHATMTSIRAVENGRYLVRVASSGISQIIDPLGNELTRIGFDVAGVDSEYISLISEKTFYTRFGWILPYLCIFVIIALGSSLLTLRVMKIIDMRQKNKAQK